MEQMICANAEKCGEDTIHGTHCKPHDRTNGCGDTCNHCKVAGLATCIPYKPKDTAMGKDCLTCGYRFVPPGETPCADCREYSNWLPAIKHPAPKDTAMEKSCKTCGRPFGPECEPCSLSYPRYRPNWQPIIKDTPLPRIVECERLRGTGTIEVWDGSELKGKIVNIKDTTMTISYNDLKEKGACEKGLIWFAENVTPGCDVKIELSEIKSMISERRTRIRDIYHADPDSWIKWLEEKYPEKKRRNPDNLYVVRYDGEIYILSQVPGSPKYFWRSLRNSYNVWGSMADIDSVDNLAGEIEFPNLKSFAEWLYKETRD